MPKALSVIFTVNVPPTLPFLNRGTMLSLDIGVGIQILLEVTAGDRPQLADSYPSIVNELWRSIRKPGQFEQLGKLFDRWKEFDELIVDAGFIRIAKPFGVSARFAPFLRFLGIKKG